MPNKKLENGGNVKSDARMAGWSLGNTTKLPSRVVPQRLTGSAASHASLSAGPPAGLSGPAASLSAGPPAGLSALEIAAHQRRRGTRFALRDAYQRWTEHGRAAWCGHRRVPGHAPQVRVRDGVAHFSAVQLCGAVWCCPVCGPRIRHQRAGEIAHALTAWATQHGPASVALLTLTVRHDARHALAQLMATVRAGFAALTAGRFGQRLRATYGVRHHIRAWDCTVGPNGWHPHLHVVLLLDAPLPPAALAALRDDIYTRWATTATANGLAAPTREHGVDLEVARDATRLAHYVGQLALELARTDIKEARRVGHRTMWQLLADACRPLADADGVLDEAVDADRERWRQWELVTAGKTAVRWSPGLRAAVALDAELSDDEAVAIEIGGDVVYTFERPDDWRMVCRMRGARHAVLLAAERLGTDGVHQLLAVLRSTGAVPDAPPPIPTPDVPDVVSAVSRRCLPDETASVTENSTPPGWPYEKDSHHPHQHPPPWAIAAA
jgi:hypothetical protein